MHSNAPDLREALYGMAPEEIGNACLLEELQMLQRPDVLTHGCPDARGIRTGRWRLKSKPMAAAIDPCGPRKGDVALAQHWIDDRSDGPGRRVFRGIRLLPGERRRMDE